MCKNLALIIEIVVKLAKLGAPYRIDTSDAARMITRKQSIFYV